MEDTIERAIVRIWSKVELKEHSPNAKGTPRYTIGTPNSPQIAEPGFEDYGAAIMTDQLLEIKVWPMEKDDDALIVSFMEELMEHAKELAINDSLTSDPRQFKAAVFECVRNGAGPKDCLRLILTCFTLKEIGLYFTF